jgi:uncharacterized membrane protein YheB (UPF0754 family)
MIYALPFLSAFIGWITNFLAIKMLFNPREEKNILGLKIQGIFPKRQKQFAEKLGALVANELLSLDDIQQKIGSESNQALMMETVSSKVDNFLDVRLKEEMPMAAMLIGKDTKAKLKTTLLTEFKDSIPEILQKVNDNIQQDLDVEKLVVEKVSNFSSDKLESILYDIMKKEFRFIEMLGAVLGFLIGLVQVGLIKLGAF